MPGKTGIPIVNITTGQRFESTKEAAATLGVLSSTVTNHLRRRTKTLLGCKYEYEYMLTESDTETDPPQS